MRMLDHLPPGATEDLSPTPGGDRQVATLSSRIRPLSSGPRREERGDDCPRWRYWVPERAQRVKKRCAHIFDGTNDRDGKVRHARYFTPSPLRGDGLKRHASITFRRDLQQPKCNSQNICACLTASAGTSGQGTTSPFHLWANHIAYAHCGACSTTAHASAVAAPGDTRMSYGSSRTHPPSWHRYPAVKRHFARHWPATLPGRQPATPWQKHRSSFDFS